MAPGGRHVEVLGSYDPHSKSAVLKEDKIKYWLSKGAQMSDTVHNLFVSKGIVSGEKIKVKVKKNKETGETPAASAPSEKKEDKTEEKPEKPEKPKEAEKVEEEKK